MLGIESVDGNGQVGAFPWDDPNVGQFTVLGEFGDLALSGGDDPDAIDSEVDERTRALARQATVAFQTTKKLDARVNAASASAQAGLTPQMRRAALANRAALAKQRQASGQKALELRARYERARIASTMLKVGKGLKRSGARAESAAVTARAKQILQTELPIKTAPTSARAARRGASRGDWISRVQQNFISPSARQASVGAGMAQARMEQLRSGIADDAARHFQGRSGVPAGAGQSYRDTESIVRGISDRATPFRALSVETAASAYGDHTTDFSGLDDGSLGGWWDDFKDAAKGAVDTVKGVIPEHTVVGKALKGDFKGAAKGAVGSVKSLLPSGRKNKKNAAKVEAAAAQSLKANVDTIAPSTAQSEGFLSTTRGKVIAGGAVLAVAAGAMYLGKRRK